VYDNEATFSQLFNYKHLIGQKIVIKLFMWPNFGAFYSHYSLKLIKGYLKTKTVLIPRETNFVQ